MINRWPKPTYLPTPDEIERECEAIQQRWSERERLRRLLYVASDPKDYASNKVDMLETKSIDVLRSQSEKLLKVTNVKVADSRMQQSKMRAMAPQYRLHADCF